MTAKAGGSILAGLTAQVMGTSAEKKAAARKLTPVEGEVAEPDPSTRWPTDLNLPGQPKGFMSHETMKASAQDLRRHAQSLLDIADALDIYTGDVTAQSAVIESIDDARARKEREADARIAEAQAAAEPESDTAAFKADFEAKQQAAQEAVYGKPEANQPSAADDEDEWRCPIHDKPGVAKTSPSSGRQYIGCPECKAFKR